MVVLGVGSDSDDDQLNVCLLFMVFGDQRRLRVIHGMISSSTLDDITSMQRTG